jgi:6-phosphogluconolactonase
MSSYRVLRFVSARQAAAALTARVVADLETALMLRGRASLAVPGGTTPGPFLTLLGYRSLDWRRIVVTLTDERWVPADHERSNARLVERTLGAAGRPYQWRPLFRQHQMPSEAAWQLDHDPTLHCWPLDVVVLGMGEDGHVASLFPGCSEWQQASGSRRFVAVTDAEGRPRISLSMSTIREAGSLYVLFSGEPKCAVLERAEADNLPVAQALRDRGQPAVVVTSP